MRASAYSTERALVNIAMHAFGRHFKRIDNAWFLNRLLKNSFRRPPAEH